MQDRVTKWRNYTERQGIHDDSAEEAKSQEIKSTSDIHVDKKMEFVGFCRHFCALCISSTILISSFFFDHHLSL